MNFEFLFSEKTLGDLNLPHRVIMAPLTRSRSSQPGDIPNDLNAEYYKQRASAALIITEATQISPQRLYTRNSLKRTNTRLAKNYPCHT